MLNRVLHAFLILAAGTLAWAGTSVVPTTTLTAETSNNTSASSSWTNTSTGNAVPGNVSKLPVRNLLYAGATTKVWAHYMPWFGESWHINVGYISSDPVQATAEANDIASRGFNGLVVDWYGANAAENNGTLAILNAINARTDGFQFMIMEDAGALKQCANTSGCNVQTQLINDITYIYNTYASSSHYYKINGRFVVPNFDVDSRYPSIDWSVVRASVPGNPLFVFRNAGGFTKSYSDGGYAWVDPINGTSTDPADLKYYTYFYPVGLQNPAKLDFGSAYKGFNDNLASWGSNRVLPQQCGQTWLQTFGMANKYFNSTTQLPDLQVVTWNDYEEGTEFETGIDNCVTVSASIAGSVVSWSISGGQENTIDHYTVFISNDGQNLMKVQDVPAGTHSLDLAPSNFVGGNYTLYVKAVGQPSILNKMSGPVSWSVTLVPNTVTITAPLPNSSVKSPVTVSASATSAYPITSLQVYVDNVLKYQVSNVASLTTSLGITKGTHTLMVQASNTQGQTWKTSETINVIGKSLAAIGTAPGNLVLTFSPATASFARLKRY